MVRPLLAFDTSAAHCAAAVMSGDTVLAHIHNDMGRGQAEALPVMIRDMMRQAGVTMSDLGAIGVGIGPGNFTGIRISVALARGMALGLGVPAIGVSRFDAMALGMDDPLACVAAPRDTVYLRAGDGAPEQMPISEIPADPQRRDVVGDRAKAVAIRTGGRVRDAAYPLAEAIARVAMTRLGDPTPPAPLYIRPADAAPAREAAAPLIG